MEELKLQSADESRAGKPLGSARVSRVGFGVFAETGFFCDYNSKKVRDGAMPSPARETRALPNPLACAV
jgi:hypothetical protein